MAGGFWEEVTRRVRGRAAVAGDEVEAAAEDVDMGRSAIDVRQAGAGGQGAPAGDSSSLAGGQPDRLEGLACCCGALDRPATDADRLGITRNKDAGRRPVCPDWALMWPKEPLRNGAGPRDRGAARRRRAEPLVEV